MAEGGVYPSSKDPAACRLCRKSENRSSLLTTAPLLKHMGVNVSEHTHTYTQMHLQRVLQSVSGGRWTREVWFPLTALDDVGQESSFRGEPKNEIQS